MARKVLIVQFTHPGGEHSLTNQEKKNGIKQWNYGSHKRKFIKAIGQYVMEDGCLSARQDLLFWGEWEPTSKICPMVSTVGTGVLPQYVHEPFLQGTSGTLILPPYKNSKGKERQNTDPCVFGDAFLYSCCKQRKKIHKSTMTQFTQLGVLDKGSIILFGSTISHNQGGPYFVLDTVFVVGDYKDYQNYHAQTDLSSFVSKDYFDLMGFHNWNKNNHFVCYKGATVGNTIDGMFSFVPCRQSLSGMVGFPRVKLTSADISFISDNLNAAPKYIDSCSSKCCWMNICDIVKKQGFELGVNFEYNYLP